LDDESARRYCFLLDVRGWVFAGCVRTLRGGFRRRQLAVCPVPSLRAERAGGLHHSSDGRRRGQAVCPERLAVVVRRGGGLPLFRHLLRVQQLSRKTQTVREAVTWVIGTLRPDRIKRPLGSFTTIRPGARARLHRACAGPPGRAGG